MPFIAARQASTKAFGLTAGSPLLISYLVVAGGAGSGSPGVRTGGGGAGGLLTSTAILTKTVVYKRHRNYNRYFYRRRCRRYI